MIIYKLIIFVLVLYFFILYFSHTLVSWFCKLISEKGETNRVFRGDELKNINIPKKIIAYKLTREDCNGCLFCGCNAEDVANTIINEIQANEGLSLEECSKFTIEPYETTQEEIDSMPEFEGW